MSFGKYLFSRFEEFADRTALVSDKQQLTYRQLRQQADCLAANFHARGVKPGDLVGLALQDTVQGIIAVLAAWRLSARVAVIDFRAPRSQRATMARGFAMAMIFESASPPGEESYPGIRFDPDWLGSRPPCDFPEWAEGSGTAFLMFTSGTTGVPKAYLQSHDDLTARLQNIRLLFQGSEQRFLTPLALTYSATRHYVFAYLMLGGTVRLMPPLFSASELTEALLAFQASATALPPPVISSLVREAGSRPGPLFPALGALISVGGPVSPDDKVAAYERLSNGFRMGYASALTGHIATLSGRDVLERPDVTGRLARGVRVEILDDAGASSAPGSVGLIKAWTPSVVSQYVLANGTATSDPATMGPGWGIPGDLGFMDENGFLTLVGRESDVIVRGGVNIAPQELEQTIAKYPGVIEAAVVGIPDEKMGQEVAAFIVAAHTTEKELTAHIRQNIAPDRRPRVVRIVPALPYNANGKLVRRQLVDMLAAEKSESGATARTED